MPHSSAALIPLGAKREMPWQCDAGAEATGGGGEGDGGGGVGRGGGEGEGGGGDGGGDSSYVYALYVGDVAIIGTPYVMPMQ